jgi:hypothetical protein
MSTAEFDTLDRSLSSAGPSEALAELIRILEERGDSRGLLDAMLLKARHELGLPLVQSGTLADIPEPERTQFEERYVDAIRHVGQRLLAAGEIGAAWPYFRAIAEKEAVAAAIEAFEPVDDGTDERLGQVIEVAFNQGVAPAKGFALILEHYGTCSAISAFEGLPPDEATRVAAAERLVRRLHADLTLNLRAEISRRGQPLPPEGASIRDLIEGRDWLFIDDAYHLDVSHLAATVRLGPMLLDREILSLAVDLTEYGRRLSERHRYEGDEPFEDTYEDHRVYLRALLGIDEDAAVDHFRAKLGPIDPDRRDEAIAAQVLVRLLVRLGRVEEAIDVAAERLGHLPDAALGCPSAPQLCQKLGQPDRLAAIARQRGDLVNYTAALLASGQPGRL